MDEAVRIRNWPITINYFSYIRLSQFLTLTASSTTATAHCRRRITVGIQPIGNYSL